MASFCGKVRRCDICKVGVSVSRLLVAAFLFPVLLHQTAIAQDADADRSEPMEEVIAIVPPTLSVMRVRIREAEENIVELFNASNDDRDYDMRCAREAPLGSHIPIRVCRTRIVDRLTARASSNFITTGFYEYPAAEIRYHENMLQEVMTRLISEDPQLYKAANEYFLLKTEYDAEREERHRDKLFVW